MLLLFFFPIYYQFEPHILNFINCGLVAHGFIYLFAWGEGPALKANLSWQHEIWQACLSRVEPHESLKITEKVLAHFVHSQMFLDEKLFRQSLFAWYQICKLARWSMRYCKVIECLPLQLGGAWQWSLIMRHKIWNCNKSAPQGRNVTKCLMFDSHSKRPPLPAEMSNFNNYEYFQLFFVLVFPLSLPSGEFLLYKAYANDFFQQKLSLCPTPFTLSCV